MERCPKCGEKYAKYPLKDENKKIIWKNIFKIDWYTVMWLIVVMILIFGYAKDTNTCREIIGDPITFCEESNACAVMYERDNPIEPQSPDNISYIKFG